MFNSGEVAWEWVFRMSRVKKHCLLFFFSFSTYLKRCKEEGKVWKDESVSSMCAFLFRNIKAYGVETFSFVGKVKYFINILFMSCIISSKIVSAHGSTEI